MAHLKYTNPEGRVELIDLGSMEVTIGRLSKCDIVIRKPTVSRRHARIFLRSNRWHVGDLGSSHGTLVNGTWVVEQSLNPGDEIKIGTEIITYLDEPLEETTRIPLPNFDSNDDPGPVDQPTDPRVRAPHDIVTEHAMDSGNLLKTIAHARRLDVTQIVRDPHALMADLGAQTKLQLPPETKQNAKPKPQSTPTSGEVDVASHLLTLVRISDELRRCTDVDSVCTTAVEMVMQATQADRGVLALRSPEGGFVPKVQRSKRSSGNVRVSSTFVDRMVSRKVALVALDTGQDAGLSSAHSVVALNIRSILCAPLWDGEEILGYLYLDSTGLGRQFGPNDLDFSSAVGHQAASEIGRLRLMDRIREEEERRRNLGRFLSADVIRHIEEEARAGRLDPTLSTREQQVTILFSDIIGFTSLSERMDPAEVKKLLDDYFDRMTEIIVDRYKGTLDKYIGDAIMALFGAPFSGGLDVDACRAVAAAVDMRDTLRDLREQRPEYSNIWMRIGINTGKVVAGMLGSQRRLEYSVIGDTVNVASRLESTAEAGGIQIGDSTYQQVRKSFECKLAGDLKVKNRDQSVRAYSVIQAL